MYKRLLEEQRENGYILEIDGKPHCIAWWCASRDKDMPDYAELTCIHSLKDNWHKGYGSMASRRAEESSPHLARLRKCMSASCDNSLKF